MPMSQRDKRALIAAAVAGAVFLVFQFGVFPIWDRWQESRADLALREKTLAKYREAVQAVGERNAEVAALEARLREAEAGLLTSQTPSLASAELQEVVKQLAAAQDIGVRVSEFLPAKPLGSGYLQVPLGLQLQCRLDQLVNFLAEVERGPKTLVVTRLQVQALGSKEKLVGVNLQLAGVMRSEAAPAETAK